MRKRLIFGFLCLLMIGVLCAFFFQFRMPYGTVAQIYLGDELIEQIDLNAVSAPYTIQVGEGNVVLVEQGAISMHSATCPDKLCVKQGKITGGVYPIVCLPNRVTVKILSKDASAPDLIAGGVAP